MISGGKKKTMVISGVPQVDVKRHLPGQAGDSDFCFPLEMENDPN